MTVESCLSFSMKEWWQKHKTMEGSEENLACCDELKHFFKIEGKWTWEKIANNVVRAK